MDNKLLEFIFSEMDKGISLEELDSLGDSYSFSRKDLLSLLKGLKVVAFARTNERGDLFDLNLRNNPYNDQSKVVPLYTFEK